MIGDSTSSIASAGVVQPTLYMSYSDKINFLFQLPLI